MKKYLISFFLVLCAGTTAAQFPRIDSMVTEPYSDLFYIHGKFGDSIGKVNIDGTEMQIDAWSDSVIAIKLTGSFDNIKCGPVTVTVNGNPSNSRILSKGWIHAFTWNDSEFIHGSDYYYYWLYDFHSFFINHKGVSKLAIEAVGSNNKLTFDFAEKKARINQLVMDLDVNYFLPGQGTYFPTVYPYPKIDYTTIESCGAPIDVKVAFKGFFSVEEIDNPIYLSLYPNPSSKELNIIYSPTENTNATFILYDLMARVVLERTINTLSGENIVKWDVSNIPNGSYIFGLISEKEQKSRLINIIH